MEMQFVKKWISPQINHTQDEGKTRTLKCLVNLYHQVWSLKIPKVHTAVRLELFIMEFLFQTEFGLVLTPWRKDIKVQAHSIFVIFVCKA